MPCSIFAILFNYTLRKSLQNEKNNIINAISHGYDPTLFKGKLEAILEEEKKIELSLQENKTISKKKKTEIVNISQLLPVSCPS